MFWEPCNQCRLKGRNVVLPSLSTLPDGPRLVLVGEAPGAEEARSKKPFVGKAGKVLDEALAKADIRREDVMIINTVLCRPPKNKLQKNESVQCRSIVENMLAGAPTDSVFVGLGSKATAFLLGEQNRSLAQSRGRGHFSTLNGRNILVVPTWHPAYTIPGYRVTKLEARRYSSQLEADIRLAANMVSDRQVNIQYGMPSSFTEAMTCLEKLAASPVIAYDTETTGLEYNAKLLGISFTEEVGRGTYIPLWIYDPQADGLVRPPWLESVPRIVALEEKLRRLFLADTPVKIGHNLKFDAQVIRHNLGVWPCGHVFDTMTAAFVENTDPNVDKYRTGNFRLETLISKYCPSILDKKKSLDQVKKTLNIKDEGFTKIPTRILSQYACGDSDATFRVAVHLKSSLSGRAKDYAFYREEVVGMTDALARAQYKGVKVDIDLALDYQDQFSREITDTVKRLKAYAKQFGVRNFNPRSGTERRALIKDKLRLPQISATEKGAFQVNRTAVTQWLIDPDISPEVKEFLTTFTHFQRVDKLKSTYIDGLLNRLDLDGCIRTEYNQIGTRTYRLSSSNPNLQNLPRREDEWSKKIKHLYIARPGCVFVGSDLSQAELRVAAVMSNDEKLISAYGGGQDIHALTASVIFNTSIETVTNEQRNVGKTVNFAVLYGTTAPTLLASICYANPDDLDLTKSLVSKYSVKDTDRYIKMFFENYTGLYQWIKDQIKFAKVHGYVDTYMGGRRYLSDLDSKSAHVKKHAENQAYNTRIQGTAALLTNRAFCQMDRQFDSRIAYPVLTVHDWNCVEVAEDYVDEYKDKVMAIMTDPYKEIGTVVPLEADLDIGDRWKPLD